MTVFERLRKRMAEHPRMTSGVVIGGAVALLAVAGVLAVVVLSGPARTGQLDASATSYPPTAEPTAEPSPTASGGAAPPVASGASPIAAPSLAARTDFPRITPGQGSPLPPSWGIVMVNGLNVRTGPGEENPVVGVLNEGDLVRVIDGVGWVEILADGLHGWAVAMPGDSPDDGIWIRSVPTPFSWTEILGVASNGQTYLAFGRWAELEYPPYEGGFEQPLFISSNDGSTWTEAREGVPGSVTDVAGGAGGFVAIGYHGYGGGNVVFSADGRTWSEPIAIDGRQHAVANGPSGWLIVSYRDETGLAATRSIDGREWDASTDVPGPGSNPELEASSAGYVVFDRLSGEAFASTDGRSWRDLGLDLAEGGWIADVELIDGRLLAISVSPGGVSTLHRGELGADGAVVWASPVDGSAFAGARLDSVSAGESGLLALGWATEALVPVAWTSADGAAWSRLDPDATALGGMVGPEPAWGDGGWVGPGVGPNGSAVWRSADGQDWSMVAEPRRRDWPDPGCPSADEASVLLLAFLRERAYDCFGDASLTIRGWVPLVDGLGGCCYPDATPAWLAGPYPTGWLTSGEADQMSFQVFVPPGVDQTLLETHTWVEVVGHFGDPAAESCRRVPSGAFPHRLESQQAVRDDCARRFVIESVRPVDGP